MFLQRLGIKPMVVMLVCCVVGQLSGCVRRSEVIRVRQDGSILIQLEIEGTEHELAHGDAMPSAASGWTVRRSVKKEDDKETHVLKTERLFTPEQALPSSLAAADDPDADLYLRFPTTIRMEERRDGVYYFFHRVYTPRPWAYTDYWHKKIFNDEVQKILAKPADEVTRAERLDVVRAFTELESFKQLEMARKALAESHPDLSVEHGLLARRAVLDVYDRDDDFYNSILDRCESLEGDAVDACFEVEADRMLVQGYDAFTESLAVTAGLSTGEIARFAEAYRRARRYHELTEQLGGQVFELRIEMPGTIVAHNADTVDQGKGGRVKSVTFNMEGDAFRDRQVDLFVVSRLSPRTPGR